MTFLHVDVATGRSHTEPTRDWGGPLQALAGLERAIRDQRDGFDPAGLPVTLATSTVSGLGAVGTARCAAIGISPLSGAVAETRAEGPFAQGLRASGVTGLALTGSAAELSYVIVTDGAARLVPCDELRGAGTGQATAALQDRHGPDAAVAVIGPAGEAGARYANIVTCGSFPLPRLGLGAVLGARRIKAVVCVPGELAPLHDLAAADALHAAYLAEIPGHPLAGWQFEPPGFGAWAGGVGAGTVSVRNFSDTTTSPSAWDGMHIDRFAAHLTASTGGCPGCPNDCIKSFDGAGLHQEAVAMLGPNLGIGDLAAIMHANARCQDLGLDTVSLGGTLGCLFEAIDRGPLPRSLARTLPASASFGAADLLPELVELAATESHPLGQGAARLARQIGQPALSMVSRSVELPPFDPRVQPGLGLMFAAAPYGPRYDAVEHDLDFDPEHGLPHAFAESRRVGLTVPAPAAVLDVQRTARLAELWSGLDALLICPFASTPTRPLTLDRVTELVHAVTGRRMQPEDVFALGALRLRHQQRINDLAGAPAGTLPWRFFDEAIRGGAHRGAILDREIFEAAAAELTHRWS